MSTPAALSEGGAGGFQRQLGLFDATMLVAGSMIGSGIFMLPVALAPLGPNAVAGWLVSGLAMANGGQYYNVGYGGEIYYNTPTTIGAVKLIDTMIHTWKVMPEGVTCTMVLRREGDGFHSHPSIVAPFGERFSMTLARPSVYDTCTMSSA